MAARTLDGMVESHLERRWRWLLTTGYDGINVTKRQYFSANRDAVRTNFLVGLRSRLDGSGWDEPRSGASAGNAQSPESLLLD